MELRKCPFCGGEVKVSGFVPDLDYHEGMKKWVLHHSCLSNEDFSCGVSVWITDPDKQVVIDKWNGVYEEQKSESL